MKIRKYNIPAHIDIEREFAIKKDGQVTFTLRINAGNIVDLNTVEYVDTRKKYPDIKQTIGEEFTISSISGERGRRNAVRDNNLQLETVWWSGGLEKSEYRKK